MDDKAFRRMVADCEHASRHAPRRFVWGTVAFAAVGYAAILGTLGLAALALNWSVARLLGGHFSIGLVLLMVGCVSLLGSLLPVLWSRQRPVEGVLITNAEAPRLFELIEKVRRKCGAPRPDQVLIDGDLNAAIVQQPRLGLLGWHRNTMVLGLPLLMALDVKQLAAVIAHEFGHLQGGHGKLGAWVYRTRRSWWMLAESRQRARLGAWWADAALALFFHQFFPRFNARAFVLSRQQEYEADGVAHRVVGTAAASQGLISINVQARFLSDAFWPEVFGAAGDSATPQIEPYRRMRKRLRGALMHPDAGRWLTDALKALPDTADTHPSLRERLAFADEKAALPEPVAVSAAEALFRDSLGPWIKRLDEHWAAGVAEQWACMHRNRTAQRQLIVELEAERAQAVLSAEDHLLWAQAAHQIEGPRAEIAVLRQMLIDHPQHAEARFELALTLVDGDDVPARAEGAELLRGLAEAALGRFSAASAKRYERWLEQHERFTELKPWREKLRLIEQQTEAAWEAVQDFDGAQRFESPGFGKRTLRPVLEMLARERAVGRAFLVMKSATAAPGWRLALLVIERARGPLGQPDANHWWEELHERVQLPCAFMVIDLAHPHWKDSERAPLVRQIVETPGACIYAGRAL